MVSSAASMSRQDDDQKLIGDRIEHAAKRGLLIPDAGKIAVEEIADGGGDKECRAQSTAAKARRRGCFARTCSRPRSVWQRCGHRSARWEAPADALAAGLSSWLSNSWLHLSAAAALPTGPFPACQLHGVHTEAPPAASFERPITPPPHGKTHRCAVRFPALIPSTCIKSVTEARSIALSVPKCGARRAFASARYLRSPAGRLRADRASGAPGASRPRNDAPHHAAARQNKAPDRAAAA